MSYSVSLRHHGSSPAGQPIRKPRIFARVITKAGAIKWFIRYTFYAFVFSLAFEDAFTDIGASLPKLLGVLLVAVCFFQPRVCFRFPPKAFAWFGAYVFVVALSGAYMAWIPPDVPDFTSALIGTIVRLVQLLVLFWISYNLLKHEKVVTGTLWALATSTILLSALQLAGVTSSVSDTGRVTAFQENPNGLATMLSLGVLALLGLAHGRAKQDWKARTLFWGVSGFMALAILQTGSRGAVLALAVTLMIFFLRGQNWTAKLKFGAIALAGVVALAGLSYSIEPVRARWERVFYEESLAGREYIFPAAVDMIVERPLLGWGPVNHLWELGPRTYRQFRDEHNLYLWVLAEVGLAGAVPFFAGLWLCWRSAWKGRHSARGVVPLLMLLFVLVSGMKGTLHNEKFFWLVLALGLASGIAAAQARRHAPVRGRAIVDAGPAVSRRRGQRVLSVVSYHPDNRS